MEWVTVSNKPKKNGIYFCFVPDCKRYNKHWDSYYWDGENFIDNSFMGQGKIVKASHYMIITEP